MHLHKLLIWIKEATCSNAHIVKSSAHCVQHHFDDTSLSTGKDKLIRKQRPFQIHEVFSISRHETPSMPTCEEVTERWHAALTLVRPKRQQQTPIKFTLASITTEVITSIGAESNFLLFLFSNLTTDTPTDHSPLIILQVTLCSQSLEYYTQHTVSGPRRILLRAE